jgi:hypothetical protein
MVFASTVTRSLDESIARLRDPAFDPWTMAVVEDPAHTPMIAPAEKPVWHATIDSYRNNAIQLTVESDHDGLLVLSETYYPGWRATVDDQPAPVFRTDHALRSVPVHRGVRKVTLTYAPESFRLGGIVTFGTLACCVVGIVLGWRRSRTAAGQPGHESKNA